MNIDNSYFDEKYFANHSEEDFINELLPSVPDKYGDDEQKKKFLVSAYEAMIGNAESESASSEDLEYNKEDE